MLEGGKMKTQETIERSDHNKIKDFLAPEGEAKGKQPKGVLEQLERLGCRDIESGNFIRVGDEEEPKEGEGTAMKYVEIWNDTHCIRTSTFELELSLVDLPPWIPVALWPSDYLPQKSKDFGPEKTWKALAKEYEAKPIENNLPSEILEEGNENDDQDNRRKIA